MSEEKNHRDFHGYLPEDEEDAPRKGHKKKPSKRYKGCPATDNHGAHIYVWIEMQGKRKAWKSGEGLGWKMVDEVWWERECVGCGKVKNRIYSMWGKRPKPADVYEVRTGQTFNWW